MLRQAISLLFTSFTSELNDKTAILLFSRTAEAEVQSGTSFQGDRCLLVASSLIRRAEALAQESGLPLFRSNEHSQVGNSFGTKISTAIAEVFTAGYERVIVMGNDCPQLRQSDLRKSIQLIEAGHTILGPDLRGGAYLFGLQKADFEATKFAALPWQEAGLFSALQELFPQSCSLHSLQDVNDGEDLRRLASWMLSQRGLAQLGQMFIVLVEPVHWFKSWLAVVDDLLPAHRGPPVLA